MKGHISRQFNEPMNKQTVLHKGIQEFNDGDYFECHETLEEVWMIEVGTGSSLLPRTAPTERWLFSSLEPKLCGSGEPMVESPYQAK